jgi:hypothetical protein
MKRTISLGFVFCLSFGGSSVAAAFETIVVGGQSYLFEPIDTPTPGATSVIQVSGINNNGVMVGTFEDSAHNTFGFVRGPGIPFTQISNGAFTQLLKINDANVAVGNSVTGAFMATVPGGAFVPITPPSGFTNLQAAGVSNQGVVVGEVTPTSAPFTTKGFEQGGGLPFTPFSPGNSPISVFPNTTAVHTHSIALTSQLPDTLIVGRIEQSGGAGGAFLAQGNPNSDIGYTNISNDLNKALQSMGIKSGFSDAQGVNGFGIIVGSFIPLPDFSRGFMDEANFFTVIDAPKSNSTSLFDINNKLQIVGGFRDNLDNEHGFIMTPLSSPIKGISPKNPVLPSTIVGPGQFVFANPLPGLWYDPPFASGFTYSLTGGASFIEVAPPPESFGFGPVELVIGGAVIDVLDPGEAFFFGPGVTTFSLLGISPLVDVGNPPVFPTFLDFAGTATSLTMVAVIAVPAPGTLILLSTGFISLVVYGWKRGHTRRDGRSRRTRVALLACPPRSSQRG